MVSMPAFGTGNAWSTCRAYGSTLEQASGLPTLTGFPHDPPTMNHTAYGDPVGGYNAAVALLIALIHRRRTGEGQLVDLSQVECMIPMVAPALIAQSALGTTPPRLGNRHPVHAPQGAFRCAGEDAWIVLTVTTDDAWRGLCGVLGSPELAGLDATQRAARAEEIEAAIRCLGGNPRRLRRRWRRCKQPAWRRGSPGRRSTWRRPPSAGARILAGGRQSVHGPPPACRRAVPGRRKTVPAGAALAHLGAAQHRGARRAFGARPGRSRPAVASRRHRDRSRAEGKLIARKGARR